MACRHLAIRFLETGDVEYQFFRHHAKVMLHRYIIEWPADKVELLGGQCLKNHGFKKSVTTDGFLLLEWDKVQESETGLGRGVNYVKRGYLTHPENEPSLWRYQEQFSIKPDFSIWLHSPFDRINAINRRSIAVFRPTSGGVQHLRPRELSERVWHHAGVLNVDWILETLDKPRRHW